MKTMTVKTQQQLNQVLAEEAFITIILDGDEFSIPDQKLLTGFTFIGKTPTTLLKLVGTPGYSFCKKSKGDVHDINQLAPLGGIAAVKDVYITSESTLELAFQDREEYKSWSSATIDRDKINVVFINETMDYLIDQSKDKSPAERFIDDLFEDFVDSVFKN